MKQKRLFGAALLAAILCAIFSACGLADSQGFPPAQTIDASAPVSQTPENSPAASPGIVPVAGSFSGGFGGGEYWGFQGYGQPSAGQVMRDYIEMKMNTFVKVGYHISIGLEENLDGYDGSTEDYFAERVEQLSGLPLQIYILYVGEENKAVIYTGDDVPTFDLDAVISAFQDESVAERPLRVMIAVMLLADELNAAMITISPG